MVSSHNRGATKAESRANHLSTYRQLDENSFEKSGSMSHRGILSPPLSPIRHQNTSQLSIEKSSFQHNEGTFVMSPRLQDTEHKLTKLKKNGFISHLRGSFSFGGHQSWYKLDNERHNESRSSLKPNNGSTRYDFNPFAVKKQGSSTARDSIQTRNKQEKPSSGFYDELSQASSVNKESATKTIKEILTRRTASIPSLNRNSNVSLDFVLKKCPIRPNTTVKFENYKPKTLNVNNREKDSIIKIEDPKEKNYVGRVVRNMHYHKGGKIQKVQPIHQTKEPSNNTSNSKGDKYSIRGFDTLLNDLKDEDEIKSKNRSNFSVFQISTVGDHSYQKLENSR